MQSKKDPTSIPKYIGRYKIIKRLAIGGMGEVFLALDPICERLVALKKIRDNLIKHSSIRKRFMREAKIASRLTHPSIIPIYTIHPEKNNLYYTMPYIEGQTLKDILKKLKEKESEGKPFHHIAYSIPSLSRIFLKVCEAVAFAHTKGIIHRDIKPENIIVGKFGEVLILDWGIALEVGEKEVNLESIPEDSNNNLTKPGKVVGTLTYMAPERALGKPASFQTDIYSLGVILYQLLTLRIPFRRISIEDYKKNHSFEYLFAPQEIAPHRDIPSQLANIAITCLEKDKEKRYSSMQPFILDVEKYIEGHPEWIVTDLLDEKNPLDWEFQENVFLSKHLALSESLDQAEWVMLMISEKSFSGNARIETNLSLKSKSQGIGFLISSPGPSERDGLEDGFCLYLGSKHNLGFRLFRSNVLVVEHKDYFLEENKSYQISIEKIENTLSLYIDNELRMQYVSHIPIVGAHIGMLYKDTNFDISKLILSLGSQNVMINCLAVPDAFLTAKDFKRALYEYYKISQSFEGRSEARDALFRAGITLLEMAKEDPKSQEVLFEDALDAFDKLHNTPAAPMEYLGKSLVMRAKKDYEEELKYLEFALRKYPKHPMISIVEEHLLFRLHESGNKNKKAAFNFTLLILTQASHLLTNKDVSSWIDNLSNTLYPIFFYESLPPETTEEEKYLHLSYEISFWLAKPIKLYEILTSKLSQSPNKHIHVYNILASLFMLGSYDLLQNVLKLEIVPSNYRACFEALLQHQIADESQIALLSKQKLPFLLLLLEKNLTTDQIDFIEKSLHFFKKHQLQTTDKLDAFCIWGYFLTGEISKGKALLDKYISQKEERRGPLSFLHRVYNLTQRNDTSFLDTLTYNLPKPPPNQLLFYYLKNQKQFFTQFEKNAFFYEKYILETQIALYHALKKEENKAKLAEDKKRGLLVENNINF